MFKIDEDLTVHITRGDTANIDVQANADGENYVFRTGDVIRFQVFTKKDCESIVLLKDVTVQESTDTVHVVLTGEDTKIGGIINKPVDYWYEVELNPDTQPQTIIGYDEDGSKVFRLYPEGGEHQ